MNSKSSKNHLLFLSFLRSRTKEELEKIVFPDKSSVNKRWVYQSLSSSEDVLTYHCLYSPTCPFYLQFQKVSNGYALVQFFDHNHSTKNKTWDNFDRDTVEGELKANRYDQYISTIKESIAFFSSQLERYRHNQLIMDDCTYRINLLNKSMVKLSQFDSGVFPIRFEDHSFEDLNNVVQHYPYYQMAYDNQNSIYYRLTNQCHVDLDSFFLDDLNNVFVWPIETELLDTNSSISSSLSQFMSFMQTLNVFDSSTKLFQNPITESQVIMKEKDRPFLPEDSELRYYSKMLSSLKHFLLPDPSILTYLQNLYLLPSPVVYGCSLLNPVLLHESLSRSDSLGIEQSIDEYNYQRSSHYYVHKAISTQLVSAPQLKSFSVSRLINELTVLFPSLFCMDDIVIENSITIAPVLFITEFLNNPPVLFLGSLRTDHWDTILIALFYDSNDHYQPIGFHLCLQETEQEWTSFFQVLQAHGLYKCNSCTVMFDGKEIVRRGVSLVVPNCTLVDGSLPLFSRLRDIWLSQSPTIHDRNFYCYLSWGLSAFLATTEEDYRMCIEKMKLVNESLAEVFVNEFSSRVLHGIVTGHCLTLVPLYQALSELPLPQVTAINPEVNCTQLIRHLMYWMVDCSDFRRDSLNLYVYNDAFAQRFTTDLVPAVIQRMVVQGASYELQKERFECKENSVLDKTTGIVYECDIEHLRCSCCLPQRMNYPCVHMIALLHHANRYQDVLKTVSTCYNKRTVELTCPQIIIAPSLKKSTYDGGNETLYSDLFYGLSMDSSIKDVFLSYWLTAPLLVDNDDTSFRKRWNFVKNI